MARRLGVFGGTFDPVHVGHLIAAAEVQSALRLDAVLFVPAADPPHKRGVRKTPADHRTAMLALAIAGNAWFAISRADLDRPGPHFTVHLLELLRDENPDAKLFFLLGTDSLAELLTWHAPERLGGLATLVVVSRPGEQPDMGALEARIPGLRADLENVSMPLVGVSATDIRARVRSGRTIRYQVPDRVAEYIARHGLYGRARTPGASVSGPRAPARRGSGAASVKPSGRAERAPMATVARSACDGGYTPRIPRLLIATTNRGKLAELSVLAAALAAETIAPDDIGLSLDVPERGSTFAENAAAKASAYAEASGLPALADDSGLEVDALGGEPGVASARWVAGTDHDRRQALLARMGGVPLDDRTARYRSAAALSWPGGPCRIAEGVVEGRIALAPRGHGGFGYDPLFLVEDGGYGGHVTMAELPAAEKNRLSHRARAVLSLAI
jgi:nicotinate (nicotinamide) nucleotide adenylyltransferase/non-canonical purine NTP pyrophosphatase (RdgB/HAM1 family)